MRLAVSIFSVLAMLTGTFWVTQGTGVVPYGTMAGDIAWAYFGLALFCLSLSTLMQVRPL